MFKKKTFALLTIISFVFALLVGCSESSTSNDGEKDVDSKDSDVQIRIGYDSGVQHPAHKALLEFEKGVEEKSDGRIDIKLFPAAQLGSVTDLMEQTRRGDVEMSFGASTLFSQTIPEFAVWDSFYLFDDEEHAHRVLDGKAGQELLKALESNGLTGLGYMEMGFRNFSNSKKPIEKIEDLEGLKIRGYSPIQIKAWESVGTSLTNLSWPEVFTSLQQNLIDGQESATTSFYEAKFYEAQKYWSLTKHVYTDYMWYANSKFMDGLSEEDHNLIKEEVRKAIELEREIIAGEEEKTLSLLPDAGIEVNEVSLEERRKMGEIMNNAIKEDIIEKTGQELYDMVMAEVEAERK